MPVRARCLLLGGFALLVASAQAEQIARPASAPPARPAYESGKGPVVAIDEAHKNTHTFASPPFQGLVQLLHAMAIVPARFLRPLQVRP